MYKASNNETVLLYNMKGQSYTQQLKAILLKMAIRIKVITPEEYNKKIGEFIGLSTNPSAQPPAVEPSSHIEDEMMVMHNFTEQRLNQLLGELRRAGIIIPLKAIITPHNSNWTSYELHAELSQEREAFQKLEQQKDNQQAEKSEKA